MSNTKDDLDLVQTLVVKHKTTLKETANLIKESYRKAPPGLYEEVQKHPQEMIDVEAICPSNSTGLVL